MAFKWRCRLCGRWYSATMNGAWVSRCPREDCRLREDAAKKNRHREAARRSARRWRQHHREEDRAAKREYYAAHREDCARRRRELREALSPIERIRINTKAELRRSNRRIAAQRKELENGL